MALKHTSQKYALDWEQTSAVDPYPTWRPTSEEFETSASHRQFNDIPPQGKPARAARSRVADQRVSQTARARPSHARQHIDIVERFLPFPEGATISSNLEFRAAHRNGENGKFLPFPPHTPAPS